MYYFIFLSLVPFNFLDDFINQKTTSDSSCKWSFNWVPNTFKPHSFLKLWFSSWYVFSYSINHRYRISYALYTSHWLSFFKYGAYYAWRKQRMTIALYSRKWCFHVLYCSAHLIGFLFLFAVLSLTVQWPQLHFCSRNHMAFLNLSCTLYCPNDVIILLRVFYVSFLLFQMVVVWIDCEVMTYKVHAEMVHGPKNCCHFKKERGLILPVFSQMFAGVQNGMVSSAFVCLH